MFKKIVLTLIASILIGLGYHSLQFLAQPVFHEGQTYATAQEKPHILLTCLTGGMGGTEEHFIKLVTMLQQHNYPTTILVEHKTPLSAQLTTQKIAHYTTRAPVFCNTLRPVHHVLLGWGMQTIHGMHPYTIIHCNNRTEVTAAKKMADKYNVKVMLSRHVPDHFNTERIRSIDAVIGVSPQISNYFEQENQIKNLGIKNICWIPPFFNPEKYQKYIPILSKKEFFNKQFGISITNAPIITMIANFYNDLNHKNHSLLINALNVFINKEGRNLTVILAGDGASRKAIEKLVQDYHLEHHVHFLGSSNKIPDILYHSDIMVLTSKKEAFGIVYLETGMMKKPAIGAYETGAEAVIVHEHTGLLFKNNDCDDLVICIKRLLDNPQFAKQLGENAKKHVLKNFTPEVTFEKYEQVYEAVNKS